MIPQAVTSLIYANGTGVEQLHETKPKEKERRHE